MSEMTLFIANKNYSSWSLRPWIAMRHREIPFEETLIPFDDEAGNPKFSEVSPTGKMPALKHGDLTVWESLAILEYLADFFPEMRLWPQDPGERATARAVSAEMATGFMRLRSACPMNMRRTPAAIGTDSQLQADVERIAHLWTTLVRRSGGPFLFGRDFTIADAMFAPVVNRIDVYRLSDEPRVREYMDTIKALPAWREWDRAARQEPWTVASDEV